MHYYHIDPGRLLELPAWQSALLYHWLPALRAEETLDMIMAYSVAQAEPKSRQGIINRLRFVARGGQPEPEERPSEEIVHDPEQAQAWFEAQGIKAA